MEGWSGMAMTPVIPEIVQQKLDTFARLEEDFIACFRFVQAVHGQQRLAHMPVADTIHYLHALWVCECKTGLLSVTKTVKEYEGQHSLRLLRAWQIEKDTAAVISFLHRKLDMLPLDEITRQIHEAQQREPVNGQVQRLMHGRKILLNRGYNLMHALDAIFGLPENALHIAVHEACMEYGHMPEQIDQQLLEMQSSLYSCIPHQTLAQRNMQVMNRLGVDTMSRQADRPGQRSWRVLPSTRTDEALRPLAEHVVQGYHELSSAPYNLLQRQFVDRPEQGGASMP